MLHGPAYGAWQDARPFHWGFHAHSLVSIIGAQAHCLCSGRVAPRSQLHREYAGLDRSAAIAVPKGLPCAYRKSESGISALKRYAVSVRSYANIGAWQDRLLRLHPLNVAQALPCYLTRLSEMI